MGLPRAPVDRLQLISSSFCVYKYICDCCLPALWQSIHLVIYVEQTLLFFFLPLDFVFVILLQTYSTGERERESERRSLFFFSSSSDCWAAAVQGLQSLFAGCRGTSHLKRRRERRPTLVDMNGSALDHDRSSYIVGVSGYGRLNIRARL